MKQLLPYVAEAFVYLFFLIVILFGVGRIKVSALLSGILVLACAGMIVVGVLTWQPQAFGQVAGMAVRAVFGLIGAWCFVNDYRDLKRGYTQAWGKTEY